MIDRSKFKGSSLNTLEDEKRRAANALPKFGGGEGRAGFHEIKEGSNWRRIAPAHNPNEPAYRAKSTVFLECEVPEIDENGTETGKVEIKNKAIFIATQHSELDRDPVLMYIAAVQQKANDEISDKEQRQKYLYPINGWRGKDGKWNWGIKPDIKFVCYAWDDQGTLGREELFPKWLDDMKKISIERSPDDAEIIPDIFTDPDEGYPLIITKNKNDKGKWDYSISCDLPSATKRESWESFFDRTRLTDDQLTELMGKESLKELYWDVYTTRDFDMAIDGLRRFDKKHKFDIFENEEFLEAISDLRLKVKQFVPWSKGEETEETNLPVKKAVESKVETPESVSRKLGINVVAVPIPKMKTVIKQYIQDNYGDDYMLPDNLTKDQIKQWYELAEAGEELPFDALNDQPDANITESKPEAKPVEKVVESEGNVEGLLKQDKSDPAEASGIDPVLAAKIAALRAKRK